MKTIFIIKEFFVITLTLGTYFLIFEYQDGWSTEGRALSLIIIFAVLGASVTFLIASIATFFPRRDLSKEFVVFVRAIKFLIIFGAMSSVLWWVW